MFSKLFNTSVAVVAVSPLLLNAVPLPNFLANGLTSVAAAEGAIDIAPEPPVADAPVALDGPSSSNAQGIAPPAPIAGAPRIAQNDGPVVQPEQGDLLTELQNGQFNQSQLLSQRNGNVGNPLPIENPQALQVAPNPLNNVSPVVNQNAVAAPLINQSNGQSFERLGPPAPERLQPENGQQLGRQFGQQFNQQLGLQPGQQFRSRLPFTDPNRQFVPGLDSDFLLPVSHGYRPVLVPSYHPAGAPVLYDHGPMVHPLPYTYAPIYSGCH